MPDSPSLFLSYNSSDRVLVEEVARSLRQRGIEPFLDRWHLNPGRRWQLALHKVLSGCDAVAVFVGPRGLGRWQQREVELALDRVDLPEFLVIPVLLPQAGDDPPLGFLKLHTWVDLRCGVDDPRQLEILARAARGEPPGEDLDGLVSETRAEVCPYRGLLPFREEDAPFFFGRETEVEELIGRVERQRLVGVVSASGAGKSSLVRAGLLPRLRSDGAGSAWEIITLTPRVDPLKELARPFVLRLAPELDREAVIDRVASRKQKFLSGQTSLQELVDRVLDDQPGSDRLLLFVDQWEELYTLCEVAEERDALLRIVLSGLDRCPRLYVVFTVRGDYWGRVLESRELAERLRESVVLLGPLSDPGLREIIERPAECVGLGLEEGLAERVLSEVRGHPASLPLLEFFLRELWEMRQGGQMTHAAGGELGVLGSIGRAAEAFVERHNAPEDELHLQRLFQRLVRPGEEAEDTRRRAGRDEFRKAELPLLEELVKDRLLVADHDDTKLNPEGVAIVYEVAHEALIRGWPRLRNWVEEDRSFLNWLQRLRSALGEHRVAGGRLTGSRLSEAVRWRQEREQDLAEEERDFIDLCLTRFRRGRLALVLAVVTVITLLAAAWLFSVEANRRRIEETDPAVVADLIARAREPWPRGHLEETELAWIRAWMRESDGVLARMENHQKRVAGLGPNTGARARLESMLALREELEALQEEVLGRRDVIKEHFELWAECGSALLRDDRFKGWDLPPHDGLLPLGRDPASGLWEFLVSGTGRIPDRDGLTRELVITPQVAIVMVLLPPGHFAMGEAGSDEFPVSEAKVEEPYFLSKFEVTEGQWERLGFRKGGSRMPRVDVSWFDARNSIAPWGLTLPTEEQWEYACRAGTIGDYSFGDPTRIEEFASLRARIEVGRRKPNPWGLHDMHGNVWEWCESAASDGRIRRGGSFSNTAEVARSAFRRSSPPGLSNSYLGFRPAKVALGSFR